MEPKLWRPAVTASRGTCVFNYNVPPEPPEEGTSSAWKLSLVLGDPVTILYESDLWYYGHTLANPALRGVFPKAYVHLHPEDHYAKEEPLVAEVNASLREWNEIYKKAFLEDNVGTLNIIKGIMRDVMGYRSSLATGKLTEEEAKETRQKIVQKTDFINHHLGLDLVVRGPNGHVLSAERTSAVALYRQHLKTSEKIKTMVGQKPQEEFTTTNSFKIMMTVKSFSSQKVGDNEKVDLVLSVYEASEAMKAPRPLCENYVIENWNQKRKTISLNDRRLRVLFGDLSKNDIADKRLFLICNVVTSGNFSSKQNNASSSSSSAAGNANNGTGGDLMDGDIYFRKPIGVAAHEITSLFTFKQGKTSNKGAESELDLPFLMGGESESLETTFRKLMFEKKGSGAAEQKVLKVNIGIIFGDHGHHPGSSTVNSSDMTANYGGRLAVARKLGLPDVILPSDVRNDLYVTLMGGEFSRLDKRQDRNVEVNMEVCDENGRRVESSVCYGIGSEHRAHYTSLVYYHEGKPRWNEVIRVTLPSDQFAGSHIRFTFSHRSRREEKAIPWAMAFLKLVSDIDGTAVRDRDHDLIVYKIEKRVEVENNNFYLEMPHIKSSQFAKLKNSNGLTPLPKDVLNIRTTLASTKLTQNEGLLSLLKWKSEPQRLNASLQTFNKKVTPKEFVKFMPDVLDALFSILMENTDSEIYDYKVFKSLVDSILLITDENSKFTQFVPVLELYINENFYATLAYNKLLVVLKECVDNSTTKPMELVQAMKCLQYVFKFVVRSRTLFANLNGGKGQEPFEELLKEVLHSLVKLMFCTSDDLYKAQTYCLKHMILAVQDLIKIFDAKTLSEILIQMITSLPKGHHSEAKISAIRDLVHCPLFKLANCRAVLLPPMSEKIKEFFESSGTSQALLEKATDTLGDVLDALSAMNSCNNNNKASDVAEVMVPCLRPVIQSVARRRKGDDNIKAVVANMVCLLREMTPEHYDKYIETFNVGTPEGRYDLTDFIMEVLGMFSDLVDNNVFPGDWHTMIMLQNNVISKALRQFAHTIRDHFTSAHNFEFQAWNNFFKCAVTFIKQPALQLEKFSENKRLKLTNSYGDMRKTMGLEVKQMWFNLGQHKINFVPAMVGDFLEMTLIPEPDLRKATIPIFFDMIQCEFFSSRFKKIEPGGTGTSNRNDQAKANFHEFEHELISKLDLFMAEAGLGDEHFLYTFKSIMLSHCEEHRSIRDSGTQYVRMVVKLMELLLEYRTTVAMGDSKENQMSCIVNLLDFYEKIGREELYVKYLKELSGLHERCHNYAEAGCTIMQYAKLLHWSDQPLTCRWEKFEHCKTHRLLKEELYLDILSKFDSGQMWEKALEICKELAEQYELETFEFTKLAELHARMSDFYKNIMDANGSSGNAKNIRPEPEYFRVAFYGRGFPAFLQNKTFVYRGKSYEKLGDFQNRMLDQFPNAELMKTMKAPSEEDKEAPVQLLQVNKVDPVMDERPMFRNKTIAPQIVSYYKVNEVNRFFYSRPYHKGPKDKDNEFASLWIERTEIRTRESFPGILQWFPIEEPPQVFELDPLENAIETMQKANDDLRSLLIDHTRNQNPPLNPLSMKLNGIIDAAVMGGTANYEKAFFTEDYIAEHPEHDDNIRRLQDLMAEQIPLLSTGLQIHDAKKPENMQPFHERLEAMFQSMKSTVEEKYGRRSCEFTVQKVSHHQGHPRGHHAHHPHHGHHGHHHNQNGPASSRIHTQLSNNSLELSQEELNRTSFNSQASIDATPLSKAKNLSLTVMSGITRRKSNVNKNNNSSNNSGAGDESRGSYSLNRSFNNILMEDSLESNHGGGQHNSLGANNSAAMVVVTENPRNSANMSNNSNINNNNRPPSGHHFFLNTSTPNHSRSPSMASNRDSVVSGDALLGVGGGPVGGGENPPMIPPKHGRDGGGGDSLSSYDGLSGSREDIVIRSTSSGHYKKKAPPPPPPILVTNSNGGDATPPTPPKKPPFKPPID